MGQMKKNAPVHAAVHHIGTTTLTVDTTVFILSVFVMNSTSSARLEDASTQLYFAMVKLIALMNLTKLNARQLQPSVTMWKLKMLKEICATGRMKIVLAINANMTTFQYVSQICVSMTQERKTKCFIVIGLNICTFVKNIHAQVCSSALLLIAFPRINCAMENMIVPMEKMKVNVNLL